MSSRRRAQAYRPGTQGNRWSHALLFLGFCLYFGFPDLPAQPHVLILFAEFLARTYRAHRSITNALSSLRTFHLMYGLAVQGFDHFQVGLWKRALPLTLRSVPFQAPAMPFRLLSDLCRRARGMGDRGRTFAALLATAFFSLARLSLLVPQHGGRADRSRVPLLGDAVVRGNSVHLLLKWGKAAQQTTEAFWVPLLPVPGSYACPVLLLRNLLLRAANRAPNTPLFSFTDGGGTGRCGCFHLASARRLLHSLLESAGVAHAGYTFHSLRRGGGGGGVYTSLCLGGTGHTTCSCWGD